MCDASMQMQAQLTLKRLRRLFDSVAFASMLQQGNVKCVKLPGESAPVNLQGRIGAEMMLRRYCLITK